MAALLATRLSDKTSEYRIEKTIVSSGVFNSVDGVYSFFKNEHPSGTTVGKFSLGLRDDAWTNGGLGYRPLEKFTDKEWIEIKKLLKNITKNYLKIITRRFLKVFMTLSLTLLNHLIIIRRSYRGKF